MRQPSRVPSLCAASAFLLALWRGVGAAPFSGGFCIDNIPAKLEGTGFASISNTSKVACVAKKATWCPLSPLNKTWEGIPYYWFSACCTGHQGQFVIPDGGEKGWPNCKKDMDAQECTRHMFHDKWYHDYIGPASGYNFQVTPNEAVVSPMKYGGKVAKAPCICPGDDPGCKIKNADGTKCLVCVTDLKCSNDQVQLGINYFKIHTIDLKTSLMAFSSWIRQEWFDRRLWFDYQCYGGADYFEVLAAAGEMEKGVISVPDIELFNNDQPIWAGDISSRNAQVYACWNGNPTRGGCGYIFWSRPGLMKALCKYEGIVEFPFDQASCQLEFAPFALDGRWQDVIARKKDGGANWLGKPDSLAIAGLTAGSQYQDYTLQTVQVMRQIVVYDCCPAAAWPTLIHTVRFKRSNDYYVIALIVPALLLVALSWISFWMDPAIGERLNYGITCILAMTTNTVTAAGLMPVCKEKLFMDYINIVSLVFGAVALLETGVVLHLYYQESDTWLEVLMPRTLRIYIETSIYKKTRHIHAKTHHTQKKPKEDEPPKPKPPAKRASVIADDKDNEDSLMRKQVYRQIFYVLDETHNMLLDLEEIEEFGQVMTNGKFDIASAMNFMQIHDKNFDGVLDLEEFVLFCEGHLVKTGDMMRFKQITQGFMEVIDRKQKTRVHMWQRRATQIDVFARWLIPAGYAIFMILLLTKDRKGLEDIMLSKSKQMPLYLIGFAPIVVSLVLYTCYGCCFFVCIRKKATMQISEIPLFRTMRTLRTNSGLGNSSSSSKSRQFAEDPSHQTAPVAIGRQEP